MFRKNLSLELVAVSLWSIFFTTAASSVYAQNTNVFPTTGSVGIGTTHPSAELDLEGGTFVIGGIPAQSSTGAAWWAFGSDGHWAGLFPSLAIWNWNSIVQAGDTAVIYSAGGAGTGAFVIAPWGSGASGMRTNSSGNVGIGTPTPSTALEVKGNITLTSGQGGSIVFGDGTTQNTAWTGVLCGGDYAESVDVSGDRKHYEPGDVLVIDPEKPGKFLKSSDPYSTAVTGIYATKPGVIGRRQNTDLKTNTTEVPMAMIGIVPVKVSAENGAIKPGDLLVTSSLLGYAMKGTDRSRMLGAIIGKALGKLDSGTGAIEMVVTLQ